MKSVAAHWDWIATYLAVRKAGSLSAAARALGLSQPTVRRQIEALEHVLGTPLFTRNGTGLIPMPDTDGLRELAAAMQSIAESFARHASGAVSGATGRVRISCSEIYAVEVLPPILATLRQTAPRIIPELSVSNHTENVLLREADIAVRLTRPAQDALLTRKVAPVPIGLFVAPGALADQVSGLDYATLKRDAPFIGDDAERILERGFRALGLDPPTNIVFRSDSQIAQLAAVRAGIAIGPCQTGIAERWGLVPVCADQTFLMECWVVTHEDLRHFAPVRTVFDHLVAGLG